MGGSLKDIFSLLTGERGEGGTKRPLKIGLAKKITFTEHILAFFDRGSIVFSIFSNQLINEC